MHGELAEHDFEVTLAAAISVAGGTAAPSNDPTASDDDAETFFSEFGFEYIDGDITGSSEHSLGEGDTGPPGLHRIIDSLSTIIWPSMLRKTGARASRLGLTPAAPTRSGDEESDGLVSLLVPGPASRSVSLSHADEMVALERWLEDVGPDDAAAVASPLAMHAPAQPQSQPETPTQWQRFGTASADSSFAQHLTGPEQASVPEDVDGFDDDFADFVGPSSGEFQALDGEGDDEMPSHAEVVAASRRIFGQPPRDAPRDLRGGDYDITSAFSALQAMKDEIRAIEDEEERRRAAARVALGFAWGLDGGHSDDGEDEDDSAEPLHEH